MRFSEWHHLWLCCNTGDASGTLCHEVIHREVFLGATCTWGGGRQASCLCETET